MEEETLFDTSNPWEACALISQNVCLSETKTDGQTHFVFEGGEKTKQIVRDFWDRKLICDVKTICEANNVVWKLIQSEKHKDSDKGKRYSVGYTLRK